MTRLIALFDVIDLSNVVFFKRITRFLQKVFGITPYRIGFNLAVGIILWIFLAIIEVVNEREWHISIPLILIFSLWGWLEGMSAYRFFRADRAFEEGSFGETGILPLECARIFVVAANVPSIFRVTVFLLFLFLFSAVFVTSLMTGNLFDFLQNLFYICPPLKLYIELIIPDPPSKSKVREWIESLRPRPLPIPVRSNG